MKQVHNILLFLFISFALISCNKAEQSMIDVSIGYFNISGLSLSCDGEILPITRAVDASLQLQILQGETVVKDYAPGDDLSKRIVLPVGNYTLKAFTPNQSEAVNDESGNPIYGLTTSFEVKEADITSLSLIVPQVNVGMNVNASDNFTANFHSISVVFSSVSGRSVTIPVTTGPSAYYYFSVPMDGKLQYKVIAYNADEEEMTVTKSIADINTAKNYSIRLELAIEP